MDDTWWLDRASTFSIDFNDEFHPVQIQQYRQIEALPLWGVTSGGRVLNQSGNWEYEPKPGDRDDEFLLRCRFASKEQALEAYQGWKGRNPDVYPATIKVSTQRKS